jgi:murein DD-endopeptidase MepM/ murein hydrolase activator NlpD
VKPEPQAVPVPAPLRATVRSGETLYDVAARNRAPVRGIIDANNLTPPYELRAGQVLTVPRPASYVVQEGDTLFGVSRRFLVDVRSLATLNDLTLQSRLRVGQPLSLPSGAKDTGFTPPGPTPTLAAVSGAAAEAPPARPVRSGTPASTSASSSSSTAGVARPAYVPPQVSEASATEAAAVGCGPAPVAARARRPAHTVADAYAAVERSPTAIAPDSPTPPSNEPPPVAQTPFEIAAVESGGGRFVWPVKGPVLSTFGPKPTLAQNDGVDIGAAFGTPVVATADGHVVFNGAVAGQGKTVLLKHYDDNWASVYGQLSRSLVKNEEKVKKGQVIACIGQGQNFAQPQLHFELRYRAAPTEKHRPVNPLLILAPGDNR